MTTNKKFVILFSLLKDLQLYSQSLYNEFSQFPSGTSQDFQVVQNGPSLTIAFTFLQSNQTLHYFSENPQ